MKYDPNNYDPAIGQPYRADYGSPLCTKTYGKTMFWIVCAVIFVLWVLASVF